MADDEYSVGNISGSIDAIRSRETVTRRVIEPLRDAGAYSKVFLDAVEGEFQRGVYGSSGTSRRGRQPLLLGLPEVEYLQAQARAICEANPQDSDSAVEAIRLLFGKEQGDNFRSFRESAALPGGLIGALFGRMVTSDPAANIDAAIHVAHAFTVHQEESESDYFSVVDDLQPAEEDPVADHLGDMELTAGLFYGYVVVDVPGLVSNLEACEPADWESANRELAAKVVKHLIHLIATVSPGAKLGSTAPYAYASLVLIEAGSRQPRSLANAFREPLDPQIDEATTALSGHLADLDAAYGANEVRRFTSLKEVEIPEAVRLPFDELATWAASAVNDGQAV